MQMTEAVLARDGWPTAEEAAAGHTQPRFHCLLAELPSGEPCKTDRQHRPCDKMRPASQPRP